jgi:hypothetical protein
MATTTLQPQIEARLGSTALMVTSEFAQLTAKQKAFVLAYISHGLTTGDYDATAAAQAAYDCAKPETARVLGWETLGKSKVKAVLNLHFRRSPEDSLNLILTDLHKAIRKSLRKDGVPSVATIESIKWYERQLRKFQPKNTEPEDDGIQRFAVGQIVEQDGRRYRIDAVPLE